MVELLQLLEERDLPEDGHGHAVLRQGEAHLLQCHDGVGRAVAGSVHGPVRACRAERERERGGDLITADCTHPTSNAHLGKLSD